MDDTSEPIDAALARAIDLAGGPAELARFITAKYGRITAQAICDWRRCPPKRVIAVEQATADPTTGVPRVSRYELRDDIYGKAPAPGHVEAHAA